MYRLHWNPGAASMAPHAALEEIAARYEMVFVDIDKAEQHDPTYLALNPHALVPTLAAGETVIVESRAILLHLADSHPDAALAPALDDPLRPAYRRMLEQEGIGALD